MIMLYHLVIIGNKIQLLLFIHCTIFKSMNYSELCTNIPKLFQSLGIYWFVNRRSEENEEKYQWIQIPVITYCRIMIRTTKKTQQNDVRACLQQEASLAGVHRKQQFWAVTWKEGATYKESKGALKANAMVLRQKWTCHIHRTDGEDVWLKASMSRAEGRMLKWERQRGSQHLS